MKKYLLLTWMRLRKNFVEHKLIMTFYCAGTIICNRIFIEVFSSVPDLYEQYLEQGTSWAAELLLLKLLEAILIYAICFCGCAYLYKCVFDLNREQNVILSMLGASKRKVITICLLETSILTISGNLLADVSAVFFYRLDILAYIVILVSVVLLSALTTLPFFIPYIRKPILDSYRNFRDLE